MFLRLLENSQITKMRFSQYNFSHEIHKNLEALEYKKPTDIQYRTIPPILRGEDVLAIAQTGTGKTAGSAGSASGKDKGAGVAGTKRRKEAPGADVSGGIAEAGHVLYLRGKKGLPVKRTHRAGLSVHCNRKGVRSLRCFCNFLPDRAVLVFRIRPVSGSDHR